MNKHLIVAITGGFATGKTTVAKIIEDEGYPVIYTDLLAKEVMTNDKNIINSIIDCFGSDAYNADNSINTQYLSNLVFSSQEKLDLLNKIVHPKVIELMEQRLYELVNSGYNLVFVESALIFETALQDGFDYIICVSCDPKIQIQRGMQRHNLSEQEISKRINSQIPIAKKEELSDFIIKNNSSIEDLKQSTLLVLNILKASL
ncbi:MAG TPA: dephospho-CoA kinase [Candidatus Kapabacteria bacterium]|jgi:dephospho-CoA kinase|nr:dephospho-CoA kinase [Candidatus Kapabacteria bacterium]HPP40045.1 dephospho-CoA kinase [Candidatus Kapabacteria bacterium]HPU23173.1 dephospho-CoA kinase [Candidatus Kapabacteria bacterium]